MYHCGVTNNEEKNKGIFGCPLALRGGLLRFISDNSWTCGKLEHHPSGYSREATGDIFIIKPLEETDLLFVGLQ